MKDQAWQRRHAIHVVSQLPDDPEDALAVLRFATVIVERFLMAPQEPLARPLSLVSAARSLSLKETDNPLSSPS
jgi:hypothetical protein